MLKENGLITEKDIEKEIKRILIWVEDCKYASKIDNIYAFWNDSSEFNTLQLVFETSGMTMEKFEELRTLVDFELQNEIPLEVFFGNETTLPKATRIF